MTESSVVYNKIAPVYTKLIESQAPTDDIQKFLSLVRPGGTILDAGCAAGRETSTFKQAGFEAIGIDASDKMIQKATENYPDMSFVSGDIRSLPFDTGSFDGIWSSATLDHVTREDIPLVLKEFNRVLKSRGVLYVSIRSGEGILKTADKFSQGVERVFTRVSTEEFKNYLHDAGFQESMFYEAPSTSRPELMSFLHTVSIKA